MDKVIVGIPTFESEEHIFTSLMNNKDEFIKVAKYNILEVVICINGSKGNIEKEIEKFSELVSEFRVITLTRLSSGKNGALNKIISYAKKTSTDILHFIDDDVTFKSGSIIRNIDILKGAQKNFNTPILVGSNFKSIKIPFSYFTKKYNILALYRYVLYNTFSLPFDINSPSPKFCIGQSVCAYVHNFPFYPDDSSGIADDGFICNHFIVKGKEFYDNYNFNPIIKPSDSVVYFKSACSVRDWIKQQKRIYTGVYYSYKLHDSLFPFLTQFFSWDYSIGKSLKLSIRRPMSFYFRLALLRALESIVQHRSNLIIKEGECPSWSAVSSTKNREKN